MWSFFINPIVASGISLGSHSSDPEPIHPQYSSVERGTSDEQGITFTSSVAVPMNVVVVVVALLRTWTMFVVLFFPEGTSRVYLRLELVQGWGECTSVEEGAAARGVSRLCGLQSR